MEFVDKVLAALRGQPVEVTVVVALAFAAIAFVVLNLASSKTLPKQSGGDAGAGAAAAAAADDGPLSPTEWRRFPLVHREEVNHNTRLYRFATKNSNDLLNLPTGQHLAIRRQVGDKFEQRSYTPVSTSDTRGHFDLIIKVYPNGVISSYVDSLKIGDEIEVRGPKGRMLYQPNTWKQVGMIAGGSGVTPMLQLARAVLSNPADKTNLALIFANIAERDILVREELEAMARKYPKRFKLFYCLNEPPAGWTQGVGFVSADMIRDNLPAPGDGVQILLCGPLPMTKSMSEHLAKLNYPQSSVFTY